MQIINGKKIAQEIRESAKEEIQKLNIRPGLAVILVGDDNASKTYIRLKEGACRRAGIYFEKWEYEKNINQELIIKKIEELNSRLEINGILVQMPLPEKFNAQEIIESIDPEKDIDGFHSKNLKKFLNNQDSLISPLIQGIEGLLKSINFSFEQKNVYLLVKAGVFADSLKKFFLNKGADVLIKNKNMGISIKKADLIVVALGKARILKPQALKDGCVVVDVGINKTEGGGVIGDFDSESAQEKNGYFTPVPGGVGPMTVAMLLKNVLDFYKKQNSRC